MRFTLSNGNVIDSYSEGSYLADQVLADLPPQVAISQIPTLRAHIWQTRSWKIFHPATSNSDFTDSYSENSYLDRSGLRTYLPRSPTVAISQILTLIAHICQTRSWHIFHPPTKQWQFHRFRLWEFIFARLGLGRSTSPLEYSFYRFLLWEFIFGWPGLERSTLLSLSQLTISQIPSSENLYLADQVLVDPPPLSLCIKGQFHRILLWEPHIWQTRSWQIYPSPHQYSDFTDSYSKSSYLADQVLGDISSQMAISQIPTLIAHIW